MAHLKYRPTEYEELLIAAQWITLESLDKEYQDYLASVVYLQLKFDEFEPLSYTSWQSMRDQWNQLDHEYQVDVQPYYDARKDGNIPYDARQREIQLLRDMDWIETCLGY